MTDANPDDDHDDMSDEKFSEAVEIMVADVLRIIPDGADVAVIHVALAAVLSDTFYSVENDNDKRTMLDELIENIRDNVEAMMTQTIQ